MKYLLTIALAVGAMFGLNACQMMDCCDSSECATECNEKDASVEAPVGPVTFNVTGMT